MNKRKITTQEKKSPRKARSRKLSVQAKSVGYSTKNKDQTQWLELFAFGISLSTSEGRPVLILKDQSNENALPVWLNPVNAGIALSDLSMGGDDSHTLIRIILNKLGVRVTRCQIDELVGHRQYAQVFFEGHPELKSLRIRADEAMSFCLAFKARIFSTREFMLRCRDVDAELVKLEMGLQSNPEIGSKNHPYVM